LRRLVDRGTPWVISPIFVWYLYLTVVPHLYSGFCPNRFKFGKLYTKTTLPRACQSNCSKAFSSPYKWWCDMCARWVE